MPDSPKPDLNEETDVGEASSSEVRADSIPERGVPASSPDLSGGKRDLMFLLLGSLITAVLAFLGVLFTFSGSLDSLLTSLLTSVGIIVGTTVVLLIVLLILGVTYSLHKGKIDAAARSFATTYIRNSATELQNNVGNLNQNIDRLSDHVGNLNDKILELDGEVQRLDEDVVEKFTGTTEGPTRNRGILNQMSTLMNRLKIADEETYFYRDDSKGTEGGFIRDERALNQTKPYDELCILGTMMGIGEKGYNVCKHVSKLVEKRLDNDLDKPPFSECRLAVPVGTDVEDSKFGLSARWFALKIISSIHNEYEKRDGKSLHEVEVQISFLSQLSDIFPALQIWGEAKCLVVPSVGEFDRSGVAEEYNHDPVADALPVALGIRRTVGRGGRNGEDTTYSLDETLNRIKKTFDNGYFNNDALTYRSRTDGVSSDEEEYKVNVANGCYAVDNVKNEIGTNYDFDNGRLAKIETESDVQSVIDDLEDVIKS